MDNDLAVHTFRVQYKTDEGTWETAPSEEYRLNGKNTESSVPVSDLFNVIDPLRTSTFRLQYTGLVRLTLKFVCSPVLQLLNSDQLLFCGVLCLGRNCNAINNVVGFVLFI